MSQLLYPVYPNSWPFVMESRVVEKANPEEVDDYWAQGWRHFGSDFFRSSLMVEEMCIKRQISLRIELESFKASKSQRRTLRKNEDLNIEFGPANPGVLEHELFDLHKDRFERNVPHSLEEFLGDRPDGKPCSCMQLSVRCAGRLIAVSFLALGKKSCSSVYAVFDPEESRRRLGILTMLYEIEYARSKGLEYYYSGYATVESSCYDYKKHFGSLMFFDWSDEWRPIDGMAL